MFDEWIKISSFIDKVKPCLDWMLFMYNSCLHHLAHIKKILVCCLTGSTLKLNFGFYPHVDLKKPIFFKRISHLQYGPSKFAF